MASKGIKESRPGGGTRVLWRSGVPKPGAYYHEDKDIESAAGYAPWLSWFEDGKFWLVFFESHNHASARVSAKKTNQRVYKKEGCCLVAVWFRVATAEELKHKDNPTEQVTFH